jgi:TonB family protein
MEMFALYLLKSVVWLSGFTVVYFLFLRNERFFILKRYYLVSGILVSIIFPFLSVHYQVELPSLVNPVDFNPVGSSMLMQVNPEKLFNYRYILLLLYLSGVLFFAFRLIWNIRLLYRTIKKADINEQGPVKLIRASEFSSPFSFFNYIFINPSISDTEVKEIMNHELVHVHQKHWFDLLIIELLRLLQWANPFAWIYTSFIRLNHEYIADEVAMQRTTDPEIYKSALLNQIFSSQIISLSNSFIYSLNKNRFEMMKRIITSPYRKLKVLFVLPVFAIVFYAFATPEYNYLTPVLNTQTEDRASITAAGEVRGVVLKEDNTPLERVNIIVTGTNTRVTTDASGNFTISNVPKEASLVISQAGYITQFIKAWFNSKMTIILKKDPDYNRQLEIRNTSTGGTGSNQLIVIDGVISDKKVKDIAPADIAQITVLKTTDKYGEKGKEGVIEIISKKKAAELGIKVPFKRQAPEDFPTFQGERFSTFRNWVQARVKYPVEAQTKKLEGYVQVNFTVETDGTVSNVRSIGSIDPILGEAVVQVVKTSPKWEPAKNPEAQIPYQSSVDLRFKLPDLIVIDEAPFVVVEQMPMYPGGDVELLNFIKANTKYPDAAKAEKIEGRVIARFFVNTEGNVEGVSILKGVHPLLDAEAARVVGLLSGFRPGMQGGKAVNVWYMVPITFSLPSEVPEAKPQEEPPFSEEPFTEVEKMPVYPGGDAALMQFIKENTQYPAEAKAGRIQGRVIVRFVITKDGNITNISVLKAVHPLLDTEAIRVVSSLSTWQPGTQGGKPVDVWYTIPITFTVK